MKTVSFNSKVRTMKIENTVIVSFNHPNLVTYFYH